MFAEHRQRAPGKRPHVRRVAPVGFLSEIGDVLR
jgi:hypothetical protein